MKRITVFAIIMVFILSTLIMPPVSLAAREDEETMFIYSDEYRQELEDYRKSIEESQEEEKNQDKTEADKTDSTDKTDNNNEAVKKSGSVTKDTSWFDYKNPEKEYKISTESQLMGLSSLVNENQIDKWKPTRVENFEGVTFTLTRDIELTQPWNPIGIGNASHFSGVFDGGGHTISNVKINQALGNSGFFGYLVGEVRNLNIEGTATSKDSNSGGMVGYLSSSGRVVNCSVDMEVTGKDKTGGIVGFNEGGLIEGSMNTGDVSGTYKVGGVVGENWGGIITSSGNKGSVQSSKRGVATYGTGGVAGRSVSATAQITECFNAGDVTSGTEATGGVVGYTNAKGSVIKDCYNVGLITIDDKSSKDAISKAYAGGIAGIVGVNGVELRNCYNTGRIQKADIMGGIVGHYINETEEPEKAYIKNNYYISGEFKSGIGEADDTSDPYLDDAATSVGEGSLHGLTSSLSVAYMKDTGEYGNNGYPVLRWQDPANDDEKEYLSVISREVQDRLDEYLVRTADVMPFGHTLMDFFSPGNITTNAFILYMEATDKKEEQLKDASYSN